MSTFKNINVDELYLESNPNAFFIFGDNLIKEGYGGAAALRDHERAIGFITKKFPDNRDESFYKPDEYAPVFFEELFKLKELIKNNSDKIFYISKLGAGLANKYMIWEKLIHHNLTSTLEKFNNVVFCWNEKEF